MGHAMPTEQKINLSIVRVVWAILGLEIRKPVIYIKLRFIEVWPVVFCVSYITVPVCRECMMRMRQMDHYAQCVYKKVIL